jgi:hypothetical protein
MENPKTLETLGTQDTGRKIKTQRILQQRVSCYARVCILLTYCKYRHVRIISITGVVWAHKSNFALPYFFYWSDSSNPGKWVVMYVCFRYGFCLSFYHFSIMWTVWYVLILIVSLVIHPCLIWHNIKWNPERGLVQATFIRPIKLTLTKSWGTCTNGVWLSDYNIHWFTCCYRTCIQRVFIIHNAKIYNSLSGAL